MQFWEAGWTAAADGGTVRSVSISGFLAQSRSRSADVLQRFRERPELLLLHCLWFICVVPLAEIAYWTYTKEISHNRVLGFEYMWRIPIGYALIFSVAGLALYGAARIRRAGVPLPVIVFIGAFVGITACLPFVVKGMHYWAILLLGAGASSQLARLAARHAYLWHLLVRRTIVFAVLLIAGLGVGFSARPYWQQRQTIAQLPAAQPGPNILLLVLDTVRTKSLSLYGYRRQTSPNLDGFAARGAVFERALSASPWTLPSHASMFTGRFPHELSASWGTPLDATYPTLAEVLSRRGYITGGFSANVGYAGAAFGVARGFSHFEDKETTAYTSVVETSFASQFIRATKLQDRFGTYENFGRKSAEKMSGDFLRWLSKQNGSRPFFAFINYYDAHAPYLPPGEFAVKFSPKPARGNPWSKALDAWSPEDAREFNDAYDGAIAYLDNQLGRLFAELERRGALKNTVVVVTSDHGEQFGEHKLLDHAASLYMPVLHVPLVIAYPGHITNRRITTPVSLRDLAATILDLAGSGASSALPGKSLAPLMSGQPQDDSSVVLFAETERSSDGYPSWYPARRGRLASITYQDVQYIVNYGTKQEELFRLSPAFDEIADVSSSDPSLLEVYRELLRKFLESARR